MMMNTTNEPKHISEVTESILSALLPPGKKVKRMGRLKIPLHVVDHCPEMMRAIMQDIEIESLYRAKKSGYQYIWGLSKKFEIVDPFGPEEYYKYDLIYSHAEGSDYYTFGRVYDDQEAAA